MASVTRRVCPIQLWIPDTRGEEFAREVARQSALVAAADKLGDDQDFVEAVSAGWDE